MSGSADDHDTPGNGVFDGAHPREGRALNMFCQSLDVADTAQVKHRYHTADGLLLEAP